MFGSITAASCFSGMLLTFIGGIFVEKIDVFSYLLLGWTIVAAFLLFYVFIEHIRSNHGVSYMSDNDQTFERLQVSRRQEDCINNLPEKVHNLPEASNNRLLETIENGIDSNTLPDVCM